MSEAGVMGVKAGARRDAELLTEGWTRRFVGAPPRLQETIALYESLGYEVHLEPVPPEALQDECQGCRLAVTLFRVVYTRPVGMRD
ncbi:MAG TPA: hypothetical protein DEP84_00550 [Chloroflexi bacterium]|nr:hypothetical protein [Chloroflexota bacterium]